MEHAMVIVSRCVGVYNSEGTFGVWLRLKKQKKTTFYAKCKNLPKKAVFEKYTLTAFTMLKNILLRSYNAKAI